jgi:molecular chaperone IbpA
MINKHYFIGFDDVFKTLEEFQRNTKVTMPTFPPYNIKKIDENKFLIEIAVAGYGKQDIEVEYQDGILSVKSDGRSDLNDLIDEKDHVYLWQGIAKRAFNHRFNLADTVQVKTAKMVNGMLKLWLENIIPDHKKPQKINIEDDDWEEHITKTL